MPLASLPLAAQSYELAARGASGARLLNLYPERMPEGSRSPFMLKPTPGLVPYQSVGTGPILAMNSLPGILYVASGTQFFRYRTDGPGLHYMGDIGPITGACSIAVGDRQVVVCNPPNAWIAVHDGGDLVQLTAGGNGLPEEGASSVCYIDGYFVYTAYSGEFFFCSKALDGADFDALDYAKSERRPDIVQWCAAHNGELWLFGLNAMSVWYDAGAADFPFRERAGTVQDRGVEETRTVAKLDRSLVFLASDRIVYRTDGYGLRRISDHALEEKIGRYPHDLRDITGCAFMWEGHECYALRMPSAPGGGRTYVYDGATQVWHERSTFRSGAEGPWRCDRAHQFGTQTLLGSWVDGTVYTMDSASLTDEGVAIRREAVLPPLVAHGARQFMSRLEVEMDAGSGELSGPLHLDWSDDAGVTWKPGRDIATGAAGDTRHRVAVNRLGSFRRRLLRLSGSGRMAVYAVDADVQAGAH